MPTYKLIRYDHWFTIFTNFHPKKLCLFLCKWKKVAFFLIQKKCVKSSPFFTYFLWFPVPILIWTVHCPVQHCCVAPNSNVLWSLPKCLCLPHSPICVTLLDAFAIPENPPSVQPHLQRIWLLTVKMKNKNKFYEHGIFKLEKANWILHWSGEGTILI